MRRNDPDFRPKPEFNIGGVGGYAVHINKEDLPLWEAKGFVPGGRPAILPMPPDKVWAWGIPQTMADVEVTHLIGRNIEGFSNSIGSQGMSGMGLWGAKLSPNENAELGEYRVYPIQASKNFIRLDGASLNFELCQSVIGALIEDVDLSERVCTLTLAKQNKSHKLTFYLDPLEPVPAYNLLLKEGEKGNIADFLIFQDRRGMLTS